MSLCVLVCETHPLPVYPIVFQHAGLLVGGKHFIIYVYFISFIVSALVLVGVVSLATCVRIKSEEGGPGEKTL